MSTISALGTGSGLDLNSLVEQLLKAERAPTENRLNQRQERFESQISALGLFSGALSGLSDAARDLQRGRGLGTRQAVSSNEDVFTASARENTAPGVFSVEVRALAEADKRASQAFASASAEIGTGTLAFTVGERAFSVVIDESNNTLAGIRDAINRAGDNRGVSASIINDADGARLILTGRNTGAENTIGVSVSNATGELGQLATANLSVVTAARDAEAVIDGFTVTSATNRIEGAIDGITLDLKAAAPDEPASLRISEDRSAVLQRVRGFVDRYNGLVDVLKGLASYDPDTDVAGPLQGNITVRAVAGQVRGILSSPTADATPLANTLAAIGITTSEGGALRIDEGRLNQVIDQRPQALEELFAGENGLGGRLTSYLSNVIGTGGVLTSQTGNLQTRLDDIGRQREALDARLERVEARFVRQFSALDSLIAELNQTSEFLGQQFAALENLRTTRRRR